MEGIIRERDAIKASTEIMSAGLRKTSDGNIGNNAGGSGNIGTAKMLPLGLPRIFPLLPLGRHRRLRLTCDDKTSETGVGKAWQWIVVGGYSLEVCGWWKTQRL
jgi:hypothetical protein